MLPIFKYFLTIFKFKYFSTFFSWYKQETTTCDFLSLVFTNQNLILVINTFVCAVMTFFFSLSFSGGMKQSGLIDDAPCGDLKIPDDDFNISSEECWESGL